MVRDDSTVEIDAAHSFVIINPSVRKQINHIPVDRSVAVTCAKVALKSILEYLRSLCIYRPANTLGPDRISTHLSPFSLLPPISAR